MRCALFSIRLDTKPLRIWFYFETNFTAHRWIVIRQKKVFLEMYLKNKKWNHCDNTPSPPRTYQLLWNNSILASDSSSDPPRYLTFLYGHKKYNRGSGRKRTKNKRTIWTRVNSKCKKGGFVTLHSLCICILTLACICAKLLQATRNASSSLTVFLTADRCRLRNANSSCLSSSLSLDSISCRLVSSAVRCWLPLCVSLRQLPLWLLFCQLLSSPTSGLVGDLESKPFFWFRTKTDKGIVCLADHLHSVTPS